jgi:hypothetical protein
MQPGYTRYDAAGNFASRVKMCTVYTMKHSQTRTNMVLFVTYESTGHFETCDEQ